MIWHVMLWLTFLLAVWGPVLTPHPLDDHYCALKPTSWWCP